MPLVGHAQEIGQTLLVCSVYFSLVAFCPKSDIAPLVSFINCNFYLDHRTTIDQLNQNHQGTALRMVRMKVTSRWIQQNKESMDFVNVKRET